MWSLLYAFADALADMANRLIKVKGIGVVSTQQLQLMIPELISNLQAPAELEDCLLGHPKVEDVAVMGIHDDYSGELPKAYIVPKPNQKPSQELGRELISYVKEKKVRYKAVKEIEFIDEIPKSASGKILRRVLRDKEKANQHGLVVREERATL